MDLTRIIVASQNNGKIVEIKKLLEDLSLEVISCLDGVKIPDVIEDQSTFEGNASKKALEIAEHLGFPALADDSGLVVAALGGKPGVHSSRFFGTHVDDSFRVKCLLELMEEVPHGERDAKFVCVAAFATPEGDIVTKRGECSGVILKAPAGDGGFGYDPIFFYPELDLTFAQMPGELKNRISHRGIALKKMRDYFQSL